MSGTVAAGRRTWRALCVPVLGVAVALTGCSAAPSVPVGPTAKEREAAFLADIREAWPVEVKNARLVEMGYEHCALDPQEAGDADSAVAQTPDDAVSLLTESAFHHLCV